VNPTQWWGWRGWGRWPRWRDELGITAALAVLACSLALGGWAWRLDRVVYDLGLTLWSRAPPPGLVIIAIDDASLQAIGRWPWRRAVHASLLERLASASPRAVALDLVLSEPDPDPAQDLLLARALRHAAPVVLPVPWRVGSAEPLQAAEPIDVLRAAATLGAAEAPVDADGVLRHAFLHAGPPDAPYPHLALALLQAGGESPHPRVQGDHDSAAGPGPLASGPNQGVTGPPSAPAAAGPADRAQGWQRDGRFLIRYAGPPGTVARVSYADVLSGAAPLAQFSGQYVLVGMTAQGLGDTLATPVNGRHQAMPGVEVIANTLYTLRSGDTLVAASDRQVAVGSVALLALLVLSFGAFGPRRALPIALVAVTLVLLASLLALGGGWWVNPVPWMLPALLAYPLWSWRRLERVVAALDQEISRLDVQPLAAPGDAPVPAAAAPGGDAIGERLRTLQHAGALLRDARRFLADAVAAMPTAMLVADEHGRVLLANPRAARLFDVASPTELQGLDLLRLLAEFSTAPAAEPATAPAFDWPAAVATASAMARSGAEGPGLAVEASLAGAGDFVVQMASMRLQGLQRLVVTVADIAPVKQAQREREEVLAFVSHDLRSPASAIVLLADLQLQGRAHTPQDELLREMRRLATRTLAMSEEFVRASHVQTQPLAPSPVRPLSLIDDALADLRAQASDRQVTLQTAPLAAGTEADATMPGADQACVAVDRALVTRAIGNLVSNALKHSPPGGTVWVQGGVLQGRLRVQVRDHGPGLSAAQLQQLEAGDQGARVQDSRGVGLGLLFVQRVARRHGGTLSASAPASGGALLTLDLAGLPIQAP
jgi:CHASE2 domain-containing sensor protein/signal transduction histidine kinase